MSKDINERINLAKAKMGTVIKDFQSSDAPQFKGKSKEKRRQMAIAAKLEAERGPQKTNEDLRKWFGKGKEGDWVRVGTDGEIKGACAREPGEGKPKCMPRAKAHSMDKDDRATAARRKRREDPVADRKGKGNKPIMVNTEEFIPEGNEPTNPALWSKAKSLAKKKFDVYPSAYANGWAAKYYKSKGGSWKSVEEENLDEKCWDGYKRVGMKKKGNRMVPNCVPEEAQVTAEAKDAREYGFEGDMVMSQLRGIKSHAEQLHDMLKPDTDLPEWVQSKITLAYDYMQTAADYMATEMNEEIYLDEELGRDNEWGRPELRKKFASMTPGQEGLTRDNIPVMDVFSGETVYENEELHEISALGAKKRAAFQAKMRKTLSDPKKIAKAKKVVAKKQAAQADKPKNLLHQLHKTQSLDDHKVHFHSGEKVKPHPAHVRKFMDKYHSLKSSIEKEAFTNRAHKSHGDFVRAVNEECNQCEMENNGVNPRYDDVMNSPEGGRIDDYDIVQLEHDVMTDIEGLTWEDMVDQYEDDELIWVDDPMLDGGEGSEEASYGEISKLAYHASQMSEALTPQGRLKKKFAAIRTKSRRTMARNLALKRVSSPDRLKKRAVRTARNMVYKRLLRGRDRSTLSAAERTRVEAMVKRFAPMVARLTVRLIPQERKIEQKRLANRSKRGQMKKN